MGTSTAIPPAYRHAALLLLAPATAWHGWSRTVFAVSLPHAWTRAVQARQAWRVVLIGWAGRASAAPAVNTCIGLVQGRYAVQAGTVIVDWQ